MESYDDALAELGTRARALRVLRGLQQRELAIRAGIGLGTVIRFEQTGKAAMVNVLRIATALGADAAFSGLFQAPKYRTLDDALESQEARIRQRVRKR